MTSRQKTQYYCFECKYAKSAYGALICKVYRGATEKGRKACLAFELKQDFIGRQAKTSQKRKNKK